MANKGKVVSAVTGTVVEVRELLGGVVEEEGRVVAATATTIQWFGQVNTTDTEGSLSE